MPMALGTSAQPRPVGREKLLEMDDDIGICDRCKRPLMRIDRIVFSWGIGHTVAKFQQVNKGQSNVHHDALEFPDGKIILLTHLCKGQRATVLQLPASPRIAADEAQRHDSFAV